MEKEKKIVFLVIMDTHFILYRSDFAENARMEKYLMKSMNALVVMRIAKLVHWKI